MKNINTLLFSITLSAQNIDTIRSIQFSFSGSNQALQAPNRFVKNSNNSFIVSTAGGDLRRLTINGDTTSLNDTSFNQIRDIEKLNDGNFIVFGNSKGFPIGGYYDKFDSSEQ